MRGGARVGDQRYMAFICVTLLQIINDALVLSGWEEIQAKQCGPNTYSFLGLGKSQSILGLVSNAMTKKVYVRMLTSAARTRHDLNIWEKCQ